MKNLKELFGLRSVEGTFGIEIEAEGEQLPVTERYWKQVNDGSLRGAFPDQRCEYVLVKPLKYKDAIVALDYLNLRALEHKSRFNFSFRTSCHVHVNVTDLTWDQYLNMIYLYLIIEEALINYCGESRKANRFCLTMQAGEGILDYIEPLFRVGPSQLRLASLERCKYAAINIAATQRYGSLEFRGMRGTADKGILDVWLRCLGELKQSAIKFANPQDIHDEFVKSSPLDFLAKVVTLPIAKALAYDGLEDDLRGNFSTTIQLPWLYKPYVEKEEEAVKPKVVINPGDVNMADYLRMREEIMRQQAQAAAPQFAFRPAPAGELRRGARIVVDDLN